MPIYEYTCKQCDQRFEKLVRSMNDTAGVPCPACGSTRTEKALSVFAVSSDSAARSSAPPMPCQGCCGDGACPMMDD